MDGWDWREMKALPVPWFDELARILTKIEEVGGWPQGLLDAYIAMIPKTDGDATPLGQRPLCVLPVVYRTWASARVGQVQDWFRSWVRESVFRAGSGRSSVEAWYTSALDIEEVLSGAVDSHLHVFVADVIQSLILLIEGSWTWFLAVWGYLPCFDMLIVSTVPMCGCGLGLLPDLVNRGLWMGAFRRDAP